MERPYPESDAAMIMNDSIDNAGRIPLQSETAANFLLDQDVLNDDPLASGADVVATGPDLAAPDRLAELTARARETAGALQARGLDFAREAQARAKQNPWIAIAAASASALAVGVILGRMFKATPEYPNEEYPSGYDE